VQGGTGLIRTVPMDELVDNNTRKAVGEAMRLCREQSLTVRALAHPPGVSGLNHCTTLHVGCTASHTRPARAGVQAQNSSARGRALAGIVVATGIRAVV
jgi:hypothetical protein